MQPSTQQHVRRRASVPRAPSTEASDHLTVDHAHRARSSGGRTGSASPSPLRHVTVNISGSPKPSPAAAPQQHHHQARASQRGKGTGMSALRSFIEYLRAPSPLAPEAVNDPFAPPSPPAVAPMPREVRPRAALPWSSPPRATSSSASLSFRSDDDASPSPLRQQRSNARGDGRTARASSGAAATRHDPFGPILKSTGTSRGPSAAPRTGTSSSRVRWQDEEETEEEGVPVLDVPEAFAQTAAAPSDLLLGTPVLYGRHVAFDGDADGDGSPFAAHSRSTPRGASTLGTGSGPSAAVVVAVEPGQFSDASGDDGASLTSSSSGDEAADSQRLRQVAKDDRMRRAIAATALKPLDVPLPGEAGAHPDDPAAAASQQPQQQRRDAPHPGLAIAVADVFDRAFVAANLVPAADPDAGGESAEGCAGDDDTDAVPGGGPPQALSWAVLESAAAVVFTEAPSAPPHGAAKLFRTLGLEPARPPSTMGSGKHGFAGSHAAFITLSAATMPSPPAACYHGVSRPSAAGWDMLRADLGEGPARVPDRYRAAFAPAVAANLVQQLRRVAECLSPRSNGGDGGGSGDAVGSLVSRRQFAEAGAALLAWDASALDPQGAFRRRGFVPARVCLARSAQLALEHLVALFPPAVSALMVGGLRPASDRLAASFAAASTLPTRALNDEDGGDYGARTDVVGDDTGTMRIDGGASKMALLPWRRQLGVFDSPLLMRVGAWFLRRKDAEHERLRRRFRRLHQRSSAGAGVSPSAALVSTDAVLAKPTWIRCFVAIAQSLRPPPLAALSTLEHEERAEMRNIALNAIARAALAGFVAAAAIASVEVSAAYILFGAMPPSILASDSFVMGWVATGLATVREAFITAVGYAMLFVVGLLVPGDHDNHPPPTSSAAATGTPTTTAVATTTAAPGSSTVSGGATIAGHDQTTLLQYWAIVGATTLVVTALEVLFLYADSLSACYDTAAVAGVRLRVQPPPSPTVVDPGSPATAAPGGDYAVTGKYPIDPARGSNGGGNATAVGGWNAVRSGVAFASLARRNSIGASALSVAQREVAREREAAAHRAAAHVAGCAAEVRAELMDAAASRCALALGHSTKTVLGVDVAVGSSRIAEYARRAMLLIRSSASAAAARMVLARVLSKFALPFVSLPLMMAWNAAIAWGGLREVRAAVLAAVSAEGVADQLIRCAVGITAASGSVHAQHTVPPAATTTQPTPLLSAPTSAAEAASLAPVIAVAHVPFAVREALVRSVLCVGQSLGHAPSALHALAASLLTHSRGGPVIPFAALGAGGEEHRARHAPRVHRHQHHDAKVGANGEGPNAWLRPGHWRTVPESERVAIVNARFLHSGHFLLLQIAMSTAAAAAAIPDTGNNTNHHQKQHRETIALCCTAIACSTILAAPFRAQSSAFWADRRGNGVVGLIIDLLALAVPAGCAAVAKKTKGAAVLPAAAAVVVLASPRIGAVKLSEAAQIKAAYQGSCRAAWAAARKTARCHVLPAYPAAAVGGAKKKAAFTQPCGDGLPFPQRLARVASNYTAGCDIDVGALHCFFADAVRDISRVEQPSTSS